MAHTNHYVDYIEISVTDITTAKAFYTGAFGWQFTDYGDAYAGIQAPDGDGEVEGLGVGRPSGSGGVLVLLYSEDLDATVAAVQSAGGAIVEEPYDYPGGRRFFFTDPDGNRLGAYEPAH